MRKASQQPNPSLASRPSRTKRRHSEVEEEPPTSGGRGLFSTIKKFIRGNAVKVLTCLNHGSSVWGVGQILVHRGGGRTLQLASVHGQASEDSVARSCSTKCGVSWRGVSCFPRNAWWNAAACLGTRTLR